MRAAAVLAGAGWLVAGAGCLSVPIPQAEADPARFYVLSTSTPPANAAAVETTPVERAAPTVHLQNVEVASYLRSRPMIVRRGANEIQFREFARWGESLDLGVARVLREELLARGAVSHVLFGGIRAPGSASDYTLTVRVLTCEGGADGSVLFRAVWELARSSSNGAKAAPFAVESPPASGANEAAGARNPATVRGDYRPTDLRWDGASEASLAAQLSAAVAGLAEEISAALKK